MAGKITTNSVVLGDSITDTQNFVLKTNADGTATLARGALGALGTVFGVNGSGALTGATLVAPVLGAATATTLSVTGNTILGDASTDTLNVGNGGLVKDASGNVGIGTSSPQSILNVYGAAGTANITMSDATLGVNYGGQIRGYGVGGSGGHLDLGVIDNGSYRCGIRITEQGNNSIFFTAGTERMRIDASGQVNVWNDLAVNGERFYQNGVEARTTQFDLGGVNRRVRVSLSNYGVVKVSIYAARTNGGPSFVWWEGVIGNHANASESAVLSSRPAGGSTNYTFGTSSAGVFNWDFNNLASNGLGSIRTEWILGGTGTTSITTY